MTTVFFGELLFRLSPPGRELLFQSPKLDVHFGGAEANVAVALASLGHATRMISAIPDNPLGEAAVGELRRRGVDTSCVRRGAGRMGLYFLTPGAGLRASEVHYDRAHSVFAETPPEGWDWATALHGATRLHLSGITPALGPGAAAACIAAAQAAGAKGIAVSFDGNYRARLWESWDSDPRAILSELIRHADILFGNHRDVSLLLGRTFAGDGADRRRTAATALFDAFPNIKMVASTARHVLSADNHEISVRIDEPEGAYQSDALQVSGIVDRIGAGDAFAAGVLHGLATGGDAASAAQSGLALTALKHSVPGDQSFFRQADIDALLQGELDVRR